ncbi:MAG: AEC family transporter [Candidatus Omnitrophica bacterium]|nr:AEC family transporter [Candidatus Omnitrophota bacterium]
MWIKFLGISLKGVFELFILGLVGFFLVKRKVLNSEGLNFLSKLVVEVSLPLMIFLRLVKNFSFTQYPEWWIYPLISFFITGLGLVIGMIFLPFLKELPYKLQFLSLVTFQNSGYLPLILISAILPKEKMEVMFIYIFLFLLGFNLIMWSFGIYLISLSRKKSLELGSLFSPPVVATLVGLIIVYLGLDKFIPGFVYRPLSMLGDSTLPLAIIVVGGSLAQLQINRFDKKAMLYLVLAKLILMPLLGLLLFIKFRLSELIGLLIILELAVPPATSLSLIVRHYQKDDLIISQGIFFGHIVSLITLPLFLSLYFTYFMIK